MLSTTSRLPGDCSCWLLRFTNPRFMSFGTNMVPATGTLPAFGINSIHKAGSGGGEKRFLVFDQSGDRTTMIFTSAFGTTTKCLSSWCPKSPLARNFHGEDLVDTDVFYDNGADVQSELHEDTEELDALLYSDGDSEYSEDEEVTSTGHSPGEQLEGSCEEVASSTKKRKLLDGSNDCSPLLMETASSWKLKRCSEYEDDADSSSGNKRRRKDKVGETMSVLRSIIPGGEGKDAVVVLDEAINYLKSLKVIITADFATAGMSYFTKSI